MIGMDMTEGNPVEQIISPITEWIGIFLTWDIRGSFYFQNQSWQTY